MTGSNRLLVVDDDPAIGDLVVQVAEGIGFQTTYVGRSDQMLETFHSLEPDLIILDLMMPGADGVQSLRALADAGCKADIILFSGADARVLQTAARLGASQGLQVCELLRKPVEIDELEAMLGRFTMHSPAYLVDALRSAIKSREVSVCFQPKVSLTSEREWQMEGVEALARWDCPGRGPVPPSEFIPLAESNGLIDDLSEIVIDKSVRQVSALHRHGRTIDLAVNLSALMLETPDAPDRMSEILYRHNLDASHLVIEITESAAMENGALAMENLTRFRLMGMKLSMDDFGTGYSSLVQLYRMPFSELKIDRSFVMELDSKEEARVIVRSIVDLAHNLNLTVCAEGVESRETLSFLRSIGCDQAQGYLIGSPMDDASLIRFDAECSSNEAAAIAAVLLRPRSQQLKGGTA